MRQEEVGNSEVIKIKEKKDKVILNIDGEKIKFPKEVLEHFNISDGDKIEHNQYKELLSYKRFLEITDYLKTLIKKKPYTEMQLLKKVNSKFNYPREGKKAINELKKMRLIDDEDFIKNYLDYFEKNNFGQYFILNYLRNQGANQKMLDAVPFNYDDELNKAFNYFESIKNKYVSNNFVKQKKKIYDDMLLRGFSVDVILSVLENLKIDVNKENEKLKKALKKLRAKYKNSTLPEIQIDNKIVNKLINQGYNFSNIKEVMSEEEKEND